MVSNNCYILSTILYNSKHFPILFSRRLFSNLLQKTIKLKGVKNVVTSILHVITCILHIITCILHVITCILHVITCILHVNLHVFNCSLNKPRILASKEPKSTQNLRRTRRKLLGKSTAAPGKHRSNQKWKKLKNEFSEFEPSFEFQVISEVRGSNSV